MNRKAEILLKWLAEAPMGPAVEIGCVRYDHETESEGFSTYYLARQCAAEGRNFYSFDIDPDHVWNAKNILNQYGLIGMIQCMEGTKGVASVRGIGFLYLDSSDNPDHTMSQYLTADMTPGGIIVIDDCHSYQAGPYGKGTQVIETVGLDNLLLETAGGYRMAVIGAE